MASVQRFPGAGFNSLPPSSVCVSGSRRNNIATAYRRQPENNLNGQIDCYPGISTEKPKHPDYALKSTRLSSFTNWCTDGLDPEKLAEAGFFYTGFGDGVRCFFCGGGIKDWERGDDVWIEHARWFPNCAFVRFSKGEDFINMCRMANIMTVSHGRELQNQDEEHARHVSADQLIEDLNSRAAKLVMTMGYSQEDIEKAIKSAREKHGEAELKAQYILEYLLDNSFTQSNSSSEPSAISSSTNTSTSETIPHVSSNENLNCSQEHSDDTETHHLQEENRTLKQQIMCKVCMDKDACIVFIPCGHMVACVECALSLRTCAVCRSVIQGSVRAYPG